MSATVEEVLALAAYTLPRILSRYTPYRMTDEYELFNSASMCDDEAILQMLNGAG